ncbi:carbon-nitrogen hydrolase family protein [Anaerovoracaceae bacterium 41-7]|jgi:omega-amidase|uniref:carbon-nitrogen hydrolase family protein n=1 Tax=Emergencia sp. 1XD21-10 TaxID=2304569 RepID=UPI00137A1ACA|nr:carbon-nitrogen hydrolase family protein [Emergencia sp. 1XD21-10]MCI9475953.1 carbon-nitrogen hydrolase family protein [Emergencia sp.]MCI9640657.1 carbon-nitrogen hydrolase family protein [Emergencia sp.]NCF00472.1 carbon-nitrogen hydrolase family protein [Emergencia sp. 1XD21-10]
MKIGVYQFSSTNSIRNNLETIRNAICLAAEQGVRLIVFHECALCGYPPIEQNIDNIPKEEIDAALLHISELAKQYKIFVAVGTVRFDTEGRFNSIGLFADDGTLMGYYDKTALWGWDTDHFIRGTKPGIFEIDNIKVGFRICFDVRFPEPFRELYKENTDICFVSFSDTSETPLPDRYNIIKSHLITRAVENVMTIVSVNSISRFQTAPTAIFDYNGEIKKEAVLNSEGLLVYDFIKPETTFGMKGRLVNSDYFLQT